MEREMKKGSSMIPIPVPPRLEDAGLEDCALPAEGIMEAFLKAAQAVKSTASSILQPHDDDGGCVEGGRPSNGEWTDTLEGNSPYPTSGESESCVSSRVGGLVEEGRDMVLRIDLDHVEEDLLLDGHPTEGEEEGGVCVLPGLEGLPDLGPGGVDEEGEGEKEEGPKLAETYV